MSSWRLTKAKQINSHPHYTKTPTHPSIFYEPPSALWISKYSESLDSWMKQEFGDRSLKSLSSSGQAEIMQPGEQQCVQHGLFNSQKCSNSYSFTPANFSWQLQDRHYRTVKYWGKEDKIIIKTGSDQQASALYWVVKTVIKNTIKGHDDNQYMLGKKQQ